MKMATRMLSEDPHETTLPHIRELPGQVGTVGIDDGPSLWRSVAQLLGSAGRQLGTIPTVAKELLKTINQARKDPAYDSIFHAPRSVLNQKITGSRRFAAQSYCLTRIKAVCEAYGTTVNDVVTAMCASALPTYLMNQ